MDMDKTKAAFEAISNEAVDLVNMLHPCCLPCFFINYVFLVLHLSVYHILC